MTTGRKSIKCLELEGHVQKEPQQTDPFPKLSALLTPEAIELSSRKALGNVVISEALPDLKKIAETHDLNLNNPVDWKEAVQIYKLEQ